MSDNNFWQYFFNAESIAVIGAKDTIGSWGYNAMRAAAEAVEVDPKRRVYAVNTNAKEVLGYKAYYSILDIPDTIDLAVIVVPAPVVPQVFRQCAEKGVKVAVIISAGFSEVDANGAALENEVKKIAREAGIRFIGPNCNGHADFYTRVASLSAAVLIPAGPMSLISQSGTLGVSIAETAAARGIGLSKFVSSGNEADLKLEDFLEYFAGDDHTRIIATYIEGLREARRFYELAKKITLEKPIIALKSGSTEFSARAAKSHTGALSGADTIYSAAFKQAGVIRAEDEEELCDLAMTFLHQPLPGGNRVAILTMGGGFGVMTAEYCEKEGLAIAELQPATIQKLRDILPPRWVPGNPVDLVGLLPSGEGEVTKKCLKALMEDENVDAVISLLPPAPVIFAPGHKYTEEQLEEMTRIGQEKQRLLIQELKPYGKPMVYIRRMTLSPIQERISRLPAGSDRIPEFSHPQRAARVLKKLAWYQYYKETRQGKQKNG